MTELPMIKWSDILRLVKPLEQYERTSDARIGDFEEEFDICTELDYEFGAYDQFISRIRQVPINTWICTDTDNEVGVYGYFFDGNVVAISLQEGDGRDDDDMRFIWASTEDAHNVYHFMMSLRSKELPQLETFDRNEIPAWWFEPQE